MLHTITLFILEAFRFFKNGPSNTFLNPNKKGFASYSISFLLFVLALDLFDQRGLRTEGHFLTHLLCVDSLITQ